MATPSRTPPAVPFASSNLRRLGPPAGGPQINKHLARLVTLLDDAFQIPGTNVRFGLDGLLGLVPGLGDLGTVVFGYLMLREARRLGASRALQGRMIGNYALDALVGLVPLLGDVFDLAFKANRKNLQLLQRHVEQNVGRA